jgi:hypothetical protein
MWLCWAVLIILYPVTGKGFRGNKSNFLLIHFSFENRHIYEIMWEKNTAGQAADDNMAQAHFMMDN